MTKEELLVQGAWHQIRFTAPFVVNGCEREFDYVDQYVRRRVAEITRRECAHAKRRFLRSRNFAQANDALIVVMRPYDYV